MVRRRRRDVGRAVAYLFAALVITAVIVLIALLISAWMVGHS